MRIRDWSSDVCSSDLQIAGRKPHEIARLGLGYVPENRDIFPGLTVRENLYPGQKTTNPGGGWSIADMFDILPSRLERAETDRKREERGTSMSVIVDIGGGGIIRKKQYINEY